MKADPAILHQIFKEDGQWEIPEDTLDNWLSQYPFFAHLHWIKARQKEGNDGILHRSALYTFYPRRLQHFITSSSNGKTAVPVPAREKKEEKLQKPVLQPLYTEDYFAYTRTRLPEHIENDKPPTMEQVKSFTGWLRMMKKPQATAAPIEHEDPEPLDINELEDEKSLRKEQVVTESMAEIWIQHGHKNKAISIYNKLILLNPEKKGYFAAKISALKKQ